MSTSEIHGKIVYVGPEGAGKTANLECLSRKLKREHRGDLKVFEGEEGTYEHLPVSLGAVKGTATSIDIYSVPGSEAHSETRARLLEDVDGVVLVADLRPERHDATLGAVEELQSALAAGGRSLDDVCLVIQYNHSDGASETAAEQLHRRIGLNDAAVFEAVASRGTGVLQTLTSLSKQVIAAVRAEQEAQATGAGDDAVVGSPIDLDQPEPSYEVTAVDTRLDASLLDTDDGEPLVLDPPPAVEAELESPAKPEELDGPEIEVTALESGDRELRLESAGSPQASDGALVIPIALRDDASGEVIELSLRIELSRG